MVPQFIEVSCSRKIQYGLLVFVRISAYNKGVTIDKEERHV